MSTASEIEAVMFKPSGDRYVFQAPNAWVFGPKRRYLVTEAQKRDILSIVTPRRPALQIAIATAAIMAWAVAVSLFLWMLSSHDNPTALDLLAMMVLIVVPLVLVLAIMMRRNLRRMQPILAEAPLTDEQITPREQRAAMADALSPRRAMLYGSLWAAVLAFQGMNLFLRHGRLPLFSDVQFYLSLFMAVIALGLAVHYFGIAVRKMRGNAKAAL